MNILFLCKKVPYPPTDGESLVIMNDLRVLKTLGHRVSLFCLNTRKHWVETIGYQDLRFWDDIYLESIDTNSFSTIIGAILSASPFQIARFYQTRIDQKIENFIQNENIDLIIFQGLAMTQYQRSAKCKKVYRVHNLEFKVWELLAVQTKNYFKKLFHQWVSNSLKPYEESKLIEFSGAVTLSKEEKHGLNEFYPQMKVETIPISIDSENKREYSSEKNGILFIGSLDWQPNREGLDWFLKNVYPFLDHLPLTIAGKGNYSCDLKNVTILQNYESTEELLANHRMMIVPLLSGAGIRIKILEAMKFGMPLVSTKIGAEGILYTQGSLIIEDEANSWISLIQKAYEQPSSLTEMSENAKISFMNYYSEEIVNHRWREFIGKLFT